MEAVMIAGLAVVVVAGFYSVLDLLDDLGIRVGRRRTEREKSPLSRRSVVSAQGRVKKMAGMNV